MGKIKNLVGNTYHKLRVISFNSVKGEKAHWNCVCDCGLNTIVAGSNLTTGKTKSCGNHKVTHGMSGHHLFKVYERMIARCYSPNEAEYKNYGGRGITVCAEWISDKSLFFDWALKNGWVFGLKMDRRNNEGNYSPDNCRFVTQKVNMRNRRITKFVEYKGEVKPLSEWCEIVGINYYITKGRLRVGWSINEALETPVISRPGWLLRNL